MNFPSGSYLVPRSLALFSGHLQTSIFVVFSSWISCRLGISPVFLSRRIYTNISGYGGRTKRDGEGRKGYVTREARGMRSRVACACVRVTFHCGTPNGWLTAVKGMRVWLCA
ncbi:hypothetical protein ALC56_05988 [Trachymyrmex septentrionalis]|uniref:Uncharacterized protein n=1 Tax=Trachymyrmex septentrionalis TaxID=34720 RepID=A0A195FFL8_9HYME|nr:hypothetical protein ALC56_05988 [Trachymyrmex septentrionalis]